MVACYLLISLCYSRLLSTYKPLLWQPEIVPCLGPDMSGRKTLFLGNIVSHRQLLQPSLPNLHRSYSYKPVLSAFPVSTVCPFTVCPSTTSPVPISAYHRPIPDLLLPRLHSELRLSAAQLSLPSMNRLRRICRNNTTVHEGEEKLCR